MFEQIYKHRKALFAFLVIESLVFSTLLLIFGKSAYFLIYVFVVVNFIGVVGLVLMMNEVYEESSMTVYRAIGKQSNEALEYGEVGMILVDESYKIIWTSSFFELRSINLVGQVMQSWVDPEITNTTGLVEFTRDNRTFEAYFKEEDLVVFVREITPLHLMTNQFKNSQMVIAYVTLDNYEDLMNKLDEQDVISLTSVVRKIMSDWTTEFDVVMRRYRGENYIAIVHESSYQAMVADKFSIVEKIKTETTKINILATVSIGIGRNKDSLLSLEEAATSALDLALSRGGDQVAVKSGEDKPLFFGGSSDASARNSKVRARVVAQTLKKMILESKNVIVMGHQMTDFDSLGACIGIVRMAEHYGVPSYMVVDGASIEKKAKSAVDVLMSKPDFKSHITTPKDYQQLFKPDTLVIVVDNHKASMTLIPALVEKAKRMVVIDHHRRSEDYISTAEIMYIEPAASSTTELVVELLQYQDGHITLMDDEATLMLTGILVDTNNLRVRTSTRTFEAAAALRKEGANVTKAHEHLQDDYVYLKRRAGIIQTATEISRGMLVAHGEEEEIVTQALLAQAANTMLDTMGIEASFAVGRIDENNVSISARSKSVVNVQMIMEQLGGGGHFSLAATKMENTTVEEAVIKLEVAVLDYLKGRVKTDESDSIK